MWVCVCVHVKTHSLHVGYSDVGPGHFESLKNLGESRWTESQDTFIRICVRSTHVYIYAGRRDEILK